MREGHFVSDDGKAVRNYMKGSFVFDLIGSFPVNIVLDALESCEHHDADSGVATECGFDRSNRLLRMLRMFKLAKLTRMLKLVQYLEYVEMVVKFNPAFLRVFRLCLWMIMYCHWFGCIWWLVADVEMNVEHAVGVRTQGLQPWTSAVLLTHARAPTLD